MIPKLRIQLHESILRGKSSDPKAQAAGYNHTYYDNECLDLEALSHFPSDKDIGVIARAASEEAESLFILLGVYPDDLHSSGDADAIQLPSIAAWFDSPVEAVDDNDIASHDIEDLQRILDDKESSPISHQAVIDETCMTLTGAALAIAAEEAATV